MGRPDQEEPVEGSSYALEGPGEAIMQTAIINPVSRLLQASLRTATVFLLGLAALVTVLPAPAWAQKEVTSNIYRQSEVSTGLPALGRRLIEQTGVLAFAPNSAGVRIRKYLPDAHVGLKFYASRTCVQCHPQQARSMHEVRARITCRQCHGKGGQTGGIYQPSTDIPPLPPPVAPGFAPVPEMDQYWAENVIPPTTAVFDREPIAGINHYYSPMNRLRRHAYICAKCHPGASASFATYVIHSPNPAMKTSRKSFALQFYVFWGMIALAGGTFVVFLPHTAMWGIREFYLQRKRKTKSELKPQD
jgi:hypothetical protein